MNEPNSDPPETAQATWQTLSVPESADNERLDAFLVRHFPKQSRVKLQRAIGNRRVLLDGQPAKSSARLKIGQTVTYLPAQPEPEGSIPEDIPIDIRFEDEHLVVINKPPGMVVHPAKGHWSGTLTAALAFHFKELSRVGGPTRPGIVHRLDRDTSGVIVIAKHDQAHRALASQFEQRTVEKEYMAIVTPAPDRDRDVIDKPIGPHPYQREKKAIRIDHPDSRPAMSFYEVVERFEGFALVRVKPKTGRTHQIRVHMAHVGSPVLCDRLYSGRASLTINELERRRVGADEVVLERQALHAFRIKISHPESGMPLEISAELPPDMENTLAALRRSRG